MPTKTIPNPSLACSPGWPVVCSVSRREPLGPQWVESPGLEGKALILRNLLLPPLQLFQRWEWGSWRAACPPWLVAWPPSAPPSPVKFPLAEARRRTSLIESRGSKVLSSEASASCLLRLQRELIVEFTLVMSIFGPYPCTWPDQQDDIHKPGALHLLHARTFVFVFYRNMTLSVCCIQSQTVYVWSIKYLTRGG